MPLTQKGKKILGSMRKTYGAKKAKEIFYASKNAGKITGVDRGFYGHMERGSIVGEYSTSGGSDILNPNEELKETR